MIGRISSWDVWGEDFVLSEQPIDAILAEAWGKVGDGGKGRLIPLFLATKTSSMRAPKDAASTSWGHHFRAVGVLWGCHDVGVICSAVWRAGGRFPVGQAHCHHHGWLPERSWLVRGGGDGRRQIRRGGGTLVLIPSLNALIFLAIVVFVFVEKWVNHGRISQV